MSRSQVVRSRCSKEPCETYSLTETLDAGVYWFRVRPLLYSSTPCSSHYVVSFAGYDGPVASVSFDDEKVARFGIVGIHPNPFAEAGTIHYELGREGGPVSLRIFDVSGRLVRILVDGSSLPGRHSVAWNGLDTLGAPVGPGVYFARLESGGAVGTRKIIRASD